MGTADVCMSLWTASTQLLAWRTVSPLRADHICEVVEKLCRVWSGELGNWLDQGNALLS